MGKTAIIASLVLANPASVKPVSDDEFAKLRTPAGQTRDYGVTVVIVNNTLVQQWADEVCYRGSNSVPWQLGTLATVLLS